MHDIVSQSTWQADFEKHLPYFTGVFGYQFRYLTPELRDEDTQEALVQTAIVFASQYRMHGHRTEDRHSISRYVVARVRRGTKCTRKPGRYSDLMDRTLTCAEGKKLARETENLRHVDAQPSRRAVSPSFRLDLAAWIDALPAPLRDYAVLAVGGADRETIQRSMDIKTTTFWSYRRRLKRLWQEYIAT